MRSQYDASIAPLTCCRYEKLIDIKPYYFSVGVTSYKHFDIQEPGPMIGLLPEIKQNIVSVTAA